MTNHKRIHLICNAHLDPVWLWQREEGIGETLSTFRVAADFCENYDNFVFCHNEAVLYEWVERYEPKLFKRIKKLVKSGKWHIMGGWYLQPDCNMISGESVIRQIELGKEYFESRFGVYPKTAINFDPFGHSRGLVQVLVKCGFKAYLFMRPDQIRCELPSEIFCWQGYGDAKITAHRLYGGYNTLRGTACKKLEEVIGLDRDYPADVATWGIGNHGGGPSRIDLQELNAYIKEHPELDIVHSTPDKFFAEIRKSGMELPVHDKELNFFATGCYTSQVRIKQLHRKLESELALTEKMLSAAWVNGKLEYSSDKIRTVAKDLAFCQFHDILPGSSIKPAEESSLQQLSHGREILARLRTDAFMSLLPNQRKAAEGDMPVFVWNPHPYPVRTEIECEMQLADHNWDDTFYDIEVYSGNERIASQVEHEDSNLNLDWRKKVVFAAELPPGGISRFECRPNLLPSPPPFTNTALSFDNGEMALSISGTTGLIDSFKIGGQELFSAAAGRVLVMQDNEDAWGADTVAYRKHIGSFKLMTKAQVQSVSGLSDAKLSPVRIIESGPVRTIVEALFQYQGSTLRTRYVIPGRGTGFEIRMQINNQTPNIMYKASFPFVDKQAECLAQDIFGRKVISSVREEKVFSQWFAAVSSEQNLACGVICDSGHGLDYYNGEMRYSLMRSPCYSALPLPGRDLVSSDRVHDRIDVGLREFTLKLIGGKADELIAEMDKQTMLFAEGTPHILFCPGGKDKNVPLQDFVSIAKGPAVITCCKKNPDKNDLILRIYNPTDASVKAKLLMLAGKIESKHKLGPFEFKTVSIKVPCRK